MTHGSLERTIVASSRAICKSSIALTALILAFPLAAATFTVTNANDSGPGSLRQAIIDANATEARDEIVGGGMLVIPSSALPEITAPIDITHVWIDGSQAGDASGLVVSAASSTLDGVFIFAFARNGFEIRADGVRLRYCHAGPRTYGERTPGNGEAGFLIAESRDVELLVPVATANLDGIVVMGGANVTLRGPYAVANLNDGLRIEGSGHTVEAVGCALTGCTRDALAENSGENLEIVGDANLVRSMNIGPGERAILVRGRGNTLRINRFGGTLAAAGVRLVGPNTAHDNWFFAPLLTSDQEHGVTIEGVERRAGIDHVRGTLVGRQRTSYRIVLYKVRSSDLLQAVVPVSVTTDRSGRALS